MKTESNMQTIAPAIRRAVPNRIFAAGAVVVALCAAFTPLAHADNAPSKTPGGSLATAAAGSTPLPAGVVARVNNISITQDQVDQIVHTTNAPDTPALRANIKEQLIARELFRQAAEKDHYATKPEVQAAIDQAKNAAIVQAYLRDQIKPAPVTDADVKAQYDKVIATLGDSEYKPSVIAVKDAATAQTILDQLKKGVDFAQLAKQYSQGPAAAQGGAQNWISFKTPIQAGNTQNWPQPLAEALVKLPQGAVSSEPVQVGDAFWILRVDQKRPTQIPPFDQTKDVLRRQLEQAAMQKATAQVVVGLIRNAHIQQ
ncbi:PPIC-type PPIASE domain protein [Paraburkholderia xenovorans LB400]|uniref:peptidylprolyl isomerase n=1 Tax=Paraburkholderia xenovorans (strain LB400) TaxID=266265 RepID=Q13JF4_PARXL|nr:peptidyl-prolyl cis-trans isomerase [Paraburkholderia xenovorans]ABE35785.1 putative PpiC-type peptidyl-prolyl cis-trans isomerase [Paraburkholderia xenovorans LB400]AIP37305.1 PPIC-type PPIASE domain protein [Paraburkholderia xenovorans LB400]